MVSTKTYFFIKGLTLWEQIQTWTHSIMGTIRNWGHFTNKMMQGESNCWYFMDDHTLPLSGLFFDTTAEDKCKWIYHTSTNSISHKSSITENETTMSWLSAKIVIKQPESTEEYDIDDWLTTLTFYTTQAPTLHELFTFWCTWKQKWYPYHTSVEFHIIDRTGDQRTLSMKKHSSCLVREMQRIVDRI